MCQFNLLILKSYQDSERCKNALLAHELGFQVIRNPSLASRLAADSVAVVTTTSHCDCDSLLGASESSTELDIHKESQRLRKKRWTEAKIQRSLADRKKQIERRRREQSTDWAQEEANWIGLCRSLLTQKVKFAILLHHFSEVFDEEYFEEFTENHISLTNLRNGGLKYLSYNELTWVSN